MLTALLENNHVMARDSDKGFTYRCPECKREVILKKGRKVIDHFAHKAPVSCSYAAGETQAHLNAKQDFYDHLKTLKLDVYVEYPLSLGNIKSRADVYVSNTQKGMPAALEIQHTNISLQEIERRTQNYQQLGIAVGWLPLIDLDKHEIDTESSRGWVIEKYSPKPFERWIHGFNYGRVWYYEHKEKTIWEGVLTPYKIDVPYSEWYEQDGNHATAGGYSKFSKRWKTLTLTGMYELSEVEFSITQREAKTLNIYNYPACHMVKITPKWKVAERKSKLS